ncbi:MAG: membrane protein insertase YidC [Verrucomicrobiota bacterium]|nr:membrane protein insertase YidC [Verrucomicrobiota bacterium]
MDKKTITGVGILFILMLTWQPICYKMGWVSPPKKITKTENVNKETNNIQEKSPLPKIKEQKDIKPDNKKETIPPALAQEELSSPTDNISTEELKRQKLETVFFDNKKGLKLIIDPNIPAIKTARLKDHLNHDRTEKMSLGHENYPILELCSADGKRENNPKKIICNTDKLLVIEEYIPSKKLRIQYQWEFDDSIKYRFFYKIIYFNDSDVPISSKASYINCGTMKPLQGATKGMMAGGTQGQAVDVFYTNEERDNFSLKAISKEEMLIHDDFKEKIQWVAVKNKYFCSIVSPQNKINGFRLGFHEIKNQDFPEKIDEELITTDLLLGKISIPSHSSTTLSFDCFIGAQQYNLLRKTGESKEKVLGLDRFIMWNVGWMSIVTKIILKSLIAIERYIGTSYGYGLAIIIITMIIKMLFWPITHKSTASMKRMQEIQPKVKAIREKHKDNPQMMNQEIMKMYKEKKVNPLGGCLPMLIQIPVFFALFNTFRSAVELRQANFLWIADLSLPDTVCHIASFPIRPLAVIMGIAMILQQKLTPSSGDPSQKKMMYFMSIFFVVLLYGMPAGLTLYWTVNQIISIFQYYFSHKYIEKKSQQEQTT